MEALAQTAAESLAGAESRLRAALRSLDLPKGSLVYRVDAGGKGSQILFGPKRRLPQLASRECAFLVRESLRWGEPFFRWAGEASFVIALPLTFNEQVIGGLLLEVPEPADNLSDESTFLKGLKRTGQLLLELLSDLNLVNTSRMHARAAVMSRERLKAEAIHEVKSEPVQEVRRIYWKLEPSLFLAMRKRDRPEARRLLNQILIGIYSHAGEDLDRIKGFVLDLVTMMTRTMVESGADPARTLGNGFDSLGALSAIHDEETLSRWVAEVLEHLIEVVEERPMRVDELRMQLILNYLRENCHEPLSRDGVAAKVGLSPAHFSRLVSQALGHSFSEELRRIRMQKAGRLLRQHGISVKQVAAACGFSDQSYFTKVFRREFNLTPQAFSRKNT